MTWRARDESSLEGIPQVDEREITLLWSFERWDGPLNGIAEYRGRRIWFDFHHEDDEARHYYYVIYELTAEQLREAELWRDTQGSWDNDLKQWIGRDAAKHDPEWLGPTFSNVRPIGWFWDGSNPKFYGIEVHYPSEEKK
jgi:hypothetical protein